MMKEIHNNIAKNEQLHACIAKTARIWVALMALTFPATLAFGLLQLGAWIGLVAEEKREEQMQEKAKICKANRQGRLVARGSWCVVRNMEKGIEVVWRSCLNRKQKRKRRETQQRVEQASEGNPNSLFNDVCHCE